MSVSRIAVARAFGVALKQARHDAAISQEELAGRTNHGQNYVSMMESGNRQPTVVVIVDLERALGLPPGELIRRTVSSLELTRRKLR